MLVVLLVEVDVLKFVENVVTSDDVVGRLPNELDVVVVVAKALVEGEGKEDEEAVVESPDEVVPLRVVVDLLVGKEVEVEVDEWEE